MTKRLFRIMILFGALGWLLVGMRLDSALSAIDAGRTPAANDWILLVLLTVGGIANVITLLQLPMSPDDGGSGAPAA